MEKGAMNKFFHLPMSIKPHVSTSLRNIRGTWTRHHFILFIVLIINTSIFSTCANYFRANTSPHKMEGDIAIAANSPLAATLQCPQSVGVATTEDFVQEYRSHFIYKNAPLKFYGYTFYRGSFYWHKPSFIKEINATLEMGTLAGQNLVRPTDFWDKQTPSQQTGDTIVWENMDYLVCTARRQGTFVVIDISAFRWLLLSKGRDPYDFNNWKAFLDSVGTHYRNQPSIAFYSIFGEPSPPKTPESTERLVNFYRAVTDELSKADQNHHLITAGGFNHMNNETPQTPWWHEIYALPHNDIVAFKTYSQKDINLIPTITSFAQQLGKPIVDEEFGLPQSMGDAVPTGEAYNEIFMARAQFFEQVYSLGEQDGVSGFIFWDLGCTLAQGSYQVSPKTPAVWHVIQSHAPRKISAPGVCRCACTT